MREKKYELVKYNNDLQAFAWELSALEMDLLIVLLVVLRNVKKKSTTVSITLLKRLSGRTNKTSNERFIRQLLKLNDHLKEMDTKKMISGKYVKFDIFSVFVIDKDRETLEVGLRVDFFYIVNNFDHYTSFDLNKFLKLKSKYSKTLFRYLESWRSTGIWSVTPVMFRRLVGVPESYEMKKVINKVIKPALEELDDYYEGLELKLVKDGNRIVRITIAYNGYKCR